MIRAPVCALTIAMLLAGSSPAAPDRVTWRRAAAAAYLDQRAEWWTTWPAAAREHGTFCVSCHTTLPYALVQSRLHARSRDADQTDAERRLLTSVRARVRDWSTVAPYYTHTALESRGTEAVINALILASVDAHSAGTRTETRLAFDQLWSLQKASGAWPWLQLGLEPWEGRHGEYFGATLAALAVGIADAAYTDNVRGRVDRLRDYLNARYADEPLANRAMLLWAARMLPGLITDDRRRDVVADLQRRRRSDGGWSLSTLQQPASAWSLRQLTIRSDGYATGLATLALLHTTPSGEADALAGAEWLVRHQSPADGSWPASSLNAARDPASDVGRFMTDAATAFATLALIEAGSRSAGL